MLRVPCIPSEPHCVRSTSLAQRRPGFCRSSVRGVGPPLLDLGPTCRLLPDIPHSPPTDRAGLVAQAASPSRRAAHCALVSAHALNLVPHAFPSRRTCGGSAEPRPSAGDDPRSAIKVNVIGTIRPETPGTFQPRSGTLATSRNVPLVLTRAHLHATRLQPHPGRFYGVLGRFIGVSKRPKTSRSSRVGGQMHLRRADM